MLLKSLNYVFLAVVLFQFSFVNSSDISEAVLQTTQMTFEDFKNLVAEKYLANQEERYHQIIRIRELREKMAAKEMDWEERAEYLECEEESLREMAGLYAQAGIDPESIDKKQAEDLTHFIARLGNRIVLNYEQSHLILDVQDRVAQVVPLTFAELKSHVIQQFTDKIEAEMGKLKRLDELGAKQPKVTKEEEAEFNVLMNEVMGEMNALFEQATSLTKNFSEEEHDQLFKYLDELFESYEVKMSVNETA